METLCTFIAKGGTGKTTTAVNLAGGLAARGSRVVLVDTDPQGGVSNYFRLKDYRGLAELLSGDEADLVRVRPNLIVVTSGGSRLYRAGEALASRPDRRRAMEHLFNREAGEGPGASLRAGQSVAGYCDYLIFDCPPNIDPVTAGVLDYVDWVLIPISMDYMSAVAGVDTVNYIRELPSAGSRTRVLGILPTLYDRRTRISRAILRLITEHFGIDGPASVTETVIRANTQIKEAPSFGATIFEHAPYSYGAADYEKLVDELLERLGKVD